MGTKVAQIALMLVPIQRTPQHQRITALNRQLYRRTERQQDFGGNMAKRQAGENRRADLGA